MYLFGASGHGKVVLEIAESLGIKIEGFVDENPQESHIYEYPVHIEFPNNAKECLISIGNNNTRKKVVERLQNYNFHTLIHPKSFVSNRSAIGLGSAVMAGVSVNSGTKVGAHCVLNTNSSVDHDCCIEDFVHISPNAALAGNVWVGEGAQVGIGAAVIQGVSIGKWAIIGAGAVVIRDVPDYAVVVGNPAKIIKYSNF